MYLLYYFVDLHLEIMQPYPLLLLESKRLHEAFFQDTNDEPVIPFQFLLNQTELFDYLHPTFQLIPS